MADRAVVVVCVQLLPRGVPESAVHREVGPQRRHAAANGVQDRAGVYEEERVRE
jgi:hypothetical protein